VAPLWKLPFSSSIPVIITVHDLIFDRYPEYMPVHWMLPYYKMMMRMSIQRADIVVTVSNHTAGDLEDFYSPSKDKVVTLPEGVDPLFKISTNTNGKNNIREKYNLQQPFILSVGARRPHKNLARLVEAFASLVERIPHNLVLVGAHDHRFEDEARKAAQRYRLPSRVQFLDWVPDEDLSAIYRLADLVVLPSIMEGFGLPALEAMASGTPLAGAANSSIAEVAGGAGRYFNPLKTEQIAQAMAQVLLNPNLQRQMREAGLQRAAEFTWDSVARRMLSVYDQLNR
ncbi:MAG: glycosyltransferase family 4 protein, partial [Anaerolineales bacterium]